MAELSDFSSFDKDEERTFVPFERAMRDNESKASRIGWGIASGMFVAFSLVVVLLYTPCSRFCARVPSVCKSDQDISAFKSNCESSCRKLESESGLKVLRDRKDAEGKTTTVPEDISGTDYVDMLASCAFSGGGGTTCEDITKNVTGRGLWCAEKTN